MSDKGVEEVVIAEVVEEPTVEPEAGEPMEVEEEEFVVEAILDHRKDKKGFSYLIKWQGFTDEDNTWEQEENIFSDELLKNYWVGKSKTGSSKPNSKNKRKADDKNDSKLEEVVLDHYPPDELKDWDSEVVEVETIEMNSNKELMIYLMWKNGCHTGHPAEIVNQKCPQKVIEFYQKHIVFSNTV